VDTIYRERANGRWEYYTYVEGRACYVSGAWAETQAARGTARIVTVD
jgi:hypothetical protein